MIYVTIIKKASAMGAKMCIRDRDKSPEKDGGAETQQQKGGEDK